LGKISTGIFVFLIGFITTPLIPLSQDFGCEIAFPLGEALLAGIIIGGGQLIGIIQVLFINLLE
jgi:FLVCR family feline leukemia virus subgroup C receptor-related protein